MTELNSRGNEPLTTDSAQSEIDSAPILSSAMNSDAEALEIRDFVDDVPVEPVSPNASSAGPVSVDSPPCWYYGVGEALAWVFGTLLIQLMVGIAIGIILVVNYVVSGQKVEMEFDHSSLLWIAGEILSVLVTILVMWWRYSGRILNELNFSRPDSRHALMIIAGTLPLANCSSLWNVPIVLGWDTLREMFPALRSIDWMNVMETIKKEAETTPLFVMIFSIAVLPAIHEELIFRGAIGRTLIANLGLWGGVLLTSFLFGLMHVHPAHALAVMPLGLVLHAIYLWTRSFWLPMLLHFANNCLATILIKYSKDSSDSHGLSFTLVEGFEIITAVIAVVSLGIGLWQSRVRLVTDDGQAWDAGRFPVRVPQDSGVHRRIEPMNPWCWKLALISCAVCHAIAVLNFMN